jgi:hypothetical protein
MRVYHFLNREYGLKDLRERRLKVTRLDDINDPFELLPTCATSEIRSRFRAFRNDVAKTLGLMCFSKTWHDPVQWSHYAEKHKGLCLGFDIPNGPKGPLFDVRYQRQRMNADLAKLNGTPAQHREELQRWFTTKFEHWRYEQEVRAFLILSNMTPESDLYYVDFDQETQLKQVIVGDCSDLSRDNINEALGDLVDSVEVFKARLAFRSYRVVKQHSDRFWR